MLTLLLVALAALLAGPLTLQVDAQETERRTTGNVCTEDRNCPENALCRQQTYCVCKEGFVYVALSQTEKACLKIAKHGDPCTHDFQCQSLMGLHSKCAEGNCTCKPEMTLVDERCYQTTVVGGRCAVDNNCYLIDAVGEPDRQAYCVRGFCQCMIQYSPRNNGTRCVKDAKLGQLCEDDEQCATEGLECHGTCLCKKGYATYEYLNICVKSVEALGDTCEYDAQCQHLTGIYGQLGIAICSNWKCACASHAISVGSPARCWFKRLPGQLCHFDQECVPEDDKPGSCVNGRCTCKNCDPDESESSDGNPAAVSFPLAAILFTAAILA